MDLVLKKRSLPSNHDFNQNRKKFKQENEFGNGMAWFRGCLIGKGCFGSVFLANLKKPNSRYCSYPPIMAVKSAEVSVSSSIQKEKEVLNNIPRCRNVIKCFGEEITNGDNGQMVYNLLLEYGSGGTLADLINESRGNGLVESVVRRYTRSILRGLCHIHNSGYVHCDLKPENVLLVGNGNGNGNRNGNRNGNGDYFTAKIGDFGLAKRAEQSSKKTKMESYWRGTPMYFSPEVVTDGVQEAPSDIWAIGCIVLEMLTTNPPWNSKLGTNSDEILTRIGENNETPLIPSTVSREGRNFLKGCFARKAVYRWTAEMLLAHPFLEGITEDEDEHDRVEESDNVFDINAISSSFGVFEDEEIEDDEEIGLLSISDDFYYWSEEESLEAERSTTDSLNDVHQYPVTFPIASAVRI